MSGSHTTHSLAEPRSCPRSCTDLFWAFSRLALQGFGGVLAVVQREMVERRGWMTRDEFLEEWAVAQIMPGPNVVNLAISFGQRYFGWRGCLATMAGLFTFPLLLVITLAVLYAEFSSHPEVRQGLRGMGAVAAGLILATGIKLIPALKRHPLGMWLCGLFGVLAFVAVALLQLPLVYTLLLLGGTSCLLVYRKL
jgi:chromate transporter